MNKKILISFFILTGFYFFSPPLLSQNNHISEQAASAVETEKQPVFTVSNAVHDFGLINETDGEAMHIFKVKNTGDAPLIISHVQSSCGCAEPVWTREPIEPGQIGDVVIIYNPNNRPGPFKKNITVYTNEKKRRQRLTILGDVIPKPTQLNTAFQDTVGTVQLESKDFLFYTLRPKEVSVKEIWIQNYADTEVSLSTENVPHFIQLELPEKLEPHKPQRLKMTIDGAKIDKKGRLVAPFLLKTKTASGQTHADNLTVTAHLIDDFGHLTPAERKNSAVLKLSTTLLEFGKLKKSGFLGIGSKPDSRHLTITNEGISPLILYSIGTDDPRVEMEALNEKTIQPGDSIHVNIFIRPKKLKHADVDTELYIVSNDARGPVRQIKITAER